MTSAPVRTLRTQPFRPRAVRLTWREIDVLRELLRDGEDNRSLAERMYLSEDTIKSHMKSLMAKTGAASRTALVVSALTGKVIVFGPRGDVVEL